jgi:hypothetical protein
VTSKFDNSKQKNFRLYDPNKYDASREPQKFNEKIMQICQEKGIYFAYKSKGREMLELSKMTNEQLIAKRKLVFEKERTKVLYE